MPSETSFDFHDCDCTRVDNIKQEYAITEILVPSLILLECMASVHMSMVSVHVLAYMMASGSKIHIFTYQPRAFEIVVRELHAIGFSGHLAFDKTVALVGDRYYWLFFKDECY